MESLIYRIKLCKVILTPQLINHKFNLSNVQFMKNIINKLHTNSGPSRKTPDLIYIPHLLRWIKTKLQFKYLKKKWDPEFSEGAFIYGTTKAVCRITEIINEDAPDKLFGLLTESARLRLINDMASKISKLQKRIIRLKPNDIKILVPTYVKLKSGGIEKQCEISLRSLALKWYDDGGNLKLVLIALQTDFIRSYSYGANAEWTINVYDVLECAILNESSQKI